MSAVLAIPAILGWLAGGALPATTILPTDILGAAHAVDSVAATVAAYAPAICAASDGPLDRVTDALDASSHGNVTIWRRIIDGLTAASDAVCAAPLSTPYERARAVLDAAAAVGKAEAALNAVAPPVVIIAPHRTK